MVPEALAAAERMMLAVYDREDAVATMQPAEVLERLGFTEREAGSLLLHAPKLCFETGSDIIRRGERAEALYILLEGEAEVSLVVGEDGRRVRLATLTPGTLFGEMALLSDAPRSADVVAVTEVSCLVVGSATIAQFRRSHPELAYSLMAAIAGQLASNLLTANVALKSEEG